MDATSTLNSDAGARARAWQHGAKAAVCDRIEPWAHGKVARATRYPSYFDFNVVRVEDDPAMSVSQLASFADEALAGLTHRRVDFDLPGAAARLQPGFQALGWTAMRVLWMRHEGPVGDGPDLAVAEVPYDAVEDLRVAWHREDFSDDHDAGIHAEKREVALRRGAQVLALREEASPVGFAQLERDGDSVEITQVYVHPGHRGHGYGTALTRAAIQRAGNVADLWISADDEDRPKRLYARLGFRAVWSTTNFLRL